MRTLSRVLIAAALAFGLGCASTDWIDRTLVTVDVTGVWTGGPGELGASAGGLQLELEQQGPTVKGFIRIQGADGVLLGGPIDGTVAGDVFHFSGARGMWEGEGTVSGDEMIGLMSRAGRADTEHGGSRPFSFRRVDSSPRPSSPSR
jgi:hypothetical protein